jgi:hypothetical protein
MELASAGESRLEKKVGELVEQRLEIDGVGELGREFRVGMLSHEMTLPGGRGKIKPWERRGRARHHVR